MSGRQPLVVLADGRDPAAHALVERWTAAGALLLTPHDLSRAGWVFHSGDAAASRAVVSGCPLAARDLGGVITRLPYVSEQALGWLVPDDRPYVAAEMNAFLLAWLAELPCPVLNRPTPGCLSGPFWRHERWVRAAARAGIPVAPMRRSPGAFAEPAVAPASVEPLTTVTVVGRQCLGAADPLLASQARRLADVAAVDLLAVRFSGPHVGAYFVGASLWPDMTAAPVADAMLAYLTTDGGNGLRTTRL